MTTLALPGRLAETLRQGDLRLVVTGAGGWIGGATLDMLMGALGPDEFRRRVFAFASSARKLRLVDGTEVNLAALKDIVELPKGPALFFHYAFLGRERVANLPLEDYAAANGGITDLVRATLDRLRPAGMFLTSSGAVYRTDREIDTDLASNPYGVLKHRDELFFSDACGAAGTKLVIARVFNLSGEYINKLASYALSSFIADALAGRPITVRATRRVERSYVHVGDVVSLALATLLDSGPAPAAFDTAGEQVVEVGDLARLIGEICGRPALSIGRPALDESQPADRYVGDPAILRSLLGRHSSALEDLPKQIGRTADYLAGQATNGNAGLRQAG